MSREEIALKPCPFCGNPGAICVLEDEPGSPASFWVNCSCGVETPERRTEDEAIALWNTRVIPAQGEPVTPPTIAWVLSDDGRRWRPLQSSPAPYPGSLNSGESDLHVTADSGAGEAIFSECAEIALEHVGAVKDEDDYSYGAGYDAACSDIANTIKTRASNRKTMDAIADRKGE
jgi:Lar family restriction alleviation protein